VTRALDGLARAFALAGGALLVTITGMSVASIVGRAVLGSPVPGDFELVQVGCGAGIAAFLPYCQARRGNIIVDFFTVRAPARVQAALDGFGALALAAVMAVLAWRTAAGMLTLKAAGEVSMIVGFPIWIGYAAIVPSLVLATLVGLATAIDSWKVARG
jgi:TRAP-type C4-dicarboxylate transport system permease small subunit